MIRLIRLLSTRSSRVFILALLILIFLINRPVRVDLKGAPTDFSGLSDFSNWPSAAQLPRRLVRHLRGSSGLDIDDRYLFVRELGSGCEGTVRLYRDTSSGSPVAIKSFQSKYRNPLPARVTEALEAEDVTYWPTEIPATILLGGSTLGRNDSGLISKHEFESSNVDILPALDYFLIRGSTRPLDPLIWHLVTPYLGKGTFIDLSKRLAAENRTFAHLDLSLRPSLHRFLGSLARMHRIGMCHNDVKPDNIFVEDHRWLLGDMGNVRELRHPYYSTSQWHRDGQWADCQANDVRRALLSYLNLVRRAAADPGAFDQQFLCRSSLLGELYWRFMEEPISARELQDELRLGHEKRSTEGFVSCPYSQGSFFWSTSKPLVSHRVNLELRWSTVPEKFKFWIH
ncbi:MAG: hypothetical protein Q9208_008173 [Pyrenodesmia sp. 3 TL-2023]